MSSTAIQEIVSLGKGSVKSVIHATVFLKPVYNPDSLHLNMICTANHDVYFSCSYFLSTLSYGKKSFLLAQPVSRSLNSLKHWECLCILKEGWGILIVIFLPWSVCSHYFREAGKISFPLRYASALQYKLEYLRAAISLPAGRHSTESLQINGGIVFVFAQNSCVIYRLVS